MQTKWLPALILALGTMLTSACHDDKEGTLQMTFKGTYDTSPLVMFNYFDYIAGQRIQFSRSEFFISDLTLIDGSGNARNLSDIELVDLTMTTSQDAEAGVTLTFAGIPAGRYNELQFGFGVAPDVNATRPVDYPSSSPLAATSRYWTAWTSYIFSKTEGNLDTLVDGTDNGNLGFAYHTGSDALYGILSVTQPVNITDGGTTRMTFRLDHRTLLGVPDDPIDIVAKPQNHSPQDTAYLRRIIDHLSDAFKVSFE